jgi:hypothetical protein
MPRPIRTCLPFLLVSACDCGGGGELSTRTGRATIDPPAIDFGDVLIPGSELGVVSIENTGNHVLAIEELWISEPEIFVVVQRPPDRLEPGAAATIGIEFTPPREGTFTGALEITTDDPTGVHAVSLTGRGVVAPPPPPSCALSVTPSSLSFAGVQVGASMEQVATLANGSGAECVITGLTITGAGASEFALLDPNPGVLAAGASAPIRISFTRTDPTERPAMLEVTSNDPATPLHQVPLVTGDTRPGLCVMPASIHFAATSGSARRDVTLTACGDRDVSIEALDFTIADPEIVLVAPPALPFSIPMGASQVVTIEHAPSDQTDDHAILTVRSDDPLVPTAIVDITGSADLVPEETGRYLYYWSVTESFESDIYRVPLQGGGSAAAYWGQSTGEGCPGCHQVSPDGRYLAIIELNVVLMTTYVVDTQTNTRIDLPLQLSLGSSFTWRPDTATSPPYQFAMGVRGDIRVGSVTGGFIGDLAGAADPNTDEAMPSWGPDGEIVFVRGTFDSNFSGFGFQVGAELVLVPEGGGAATPLPGASQNGRSNYYPAYSPSGRWISFTESAAGSTYAAADAQVRLVAADRSGTVLDLPTINGSGGSTSFPTWSIDGSYLSISSNRPGGAGDWDIYIAPIDEATGAELGPPIDMATANTPGFEHAAVWSP